MKKIFRIPGMLWDQSACHPDHSVFMSVNLDLEENPGYQSQKQYAAAYHNYIHIWFVEQVRKVTINIDQNEFTFNFQASIQ